MGFSSTLWRAKPGIVALIILGLVELLVIDVAGISIKISIIGSGIFLVLSPIICVLSLFAIGWEVVKRPQDSANSAIAGAKTGALIAFFASLFVEAAIVALSLFGRGVAKLFPTSGWGAYQIIAYGLILMLVPAAYAVLGAMTGAATVYLVNKRANKT